MDGWMDGLMDGSLDGLIAGWLVVLGWMVPYRERFEYLLVGWMRKSCIGYDYDSRPDQ
jgi:hypothetical protein